MRISSFLLIFFAIRSFALDDFRAYSLDDWIVFQKQAAIEKLFANISPADAVTGVVVASPQRDNPDYYYHWVRDAALTMDVVRELSLQTKKVQQRNKFDQAVRDYVSFSRSNQLSQALTGLGEPKFHVNGSAFFGPWGRPQNDGPALRALTLARYAKTLLQNGDQQYVKTWLYGLESPATTVIKTDLLYVAQHWRDTSFDVWEEVRADHFYTRMVQRAALLQGAVLAEQLNDHYTAKYFQEQALRIEAELPHHWDGRLIQVSLNRAEGVDYKSSGLDSATLLATLHSTIQQSSCVFCVLDHRVFANLKMMEKTFQNLYAINHRPNVAGVALGRYPEDQYSGSDFNGGNPWVLSTAAAAEYYYRLSVEMPKNGIFGLNPEEAVRLGDQFLERLKYHANPDGSMSEQLNRHNGYMTSARDLTWSYASFLSAVWAREKAVGKMARKIARQITTSAKQSSYQNISK